MDNPPPYSYPQNSKGYPADGQPDYPPAFVQQDYFQSSGQPGYPPPFGQPGYPTGCVQPGYPPTFGQPGYPTACVQPGYPPTFGQPGYPTTAACGQQGDPPPYVPNQSSLQQRCVVVNTAAPEASPVVVCQSGFHVSFVGAMILSCAVFWLCGCVLGLFAFILAMAGQSSAAEGDTRAAIQYRSLSYAFSAAGIVVGIIIISVVNTAR